MKMNHRGAAGSVFLFFLAAISALPFFGAEDIRKENSSSVRGRNGTRLALTLEEALNLGLKASKALHASAARVDAAAARSKEVEAGRLPFLKFGAGYTRLSEVPPFEVTLPFSSNPQSPGSNTFVVSPSYFNNYSLRIGIQQPLFTGFRLQAGSEAARFAARAAEEELIKDKSDVAFSVLEAYWNLYKAREFKKAVDENVAQVNAHLSDVRNLFDHGLLTRNEVLRVEVQLSQAELAGFDAGTGAEMAQVRLNSLMGIPLDTEIDLATGISERVGTRMPGAGLEGNVDELTSKALDRRPELRAFDLRAKAAGAGVRVAKSGWYPQVFLTGNYYDIRPNPRLLPAKDRFYSTWDLGVSVSLDLWNWGQTKRQTQQAEAQLSEAVDALGQVKDAVSVEVRQAWLFLRQAEEKISVARKATAQAEENLRVTRERFKEGVALNADVLDAEVTLLQARTSLAQSLVDRELADARLQKAVGKF